MWVGVEAGIDPVRFEADILSLGPVAQQPRHQVSLVTVERRQGSLQRPDRRQPRGIPVGESQAQQLDPNPVPIQQLPGHIQVAYRPELQQHAQMIRQLGVIDLPAGPPVRLLEFHQGHTTLAAVTVGVIGQVQRASAGVVEGFYECALRGPQTRRGEVID